MRGPTVVCAIVDEVCWLPTGDAANNDVSILEALRPALAPIRGAPPRRLIAISSAGYRRGWAYETVRANHGRVGAEPLTLIATTEQVNPNIDRAWLERRREASPAVYQREFLSQFADSEATAAWFGADVVRNAVGPVIGERRDDRRYTVAVDAAFRRDAFAIAVCSSRLIDGINAVRKPWTGGNSETSKVSRFSAMRDAMADGSLRIPQNDRLVAELLGISSTILPSGAERLEAAPGQKDDLACAAVLAYSCAAEQKQTFRGVVDRRIFPY